MKTSSGTPPILRPQHSSLRLDAARGVSSLIVFAAHIGQILLWRVTGPQSLYAIVSGAAARHAVIVFFLLSGHLITRSVVSGIRKHGTFRIRDYAIARVARIYPPLIGAIVICIIAWAIVRLLHLPGYLPYGLPGDPYRVRDHFTLPPAGLLGAITMQGGLDDADSPLWTLYIECQIYLLVLAVAALWQREWRARMAALLVGAVAIYLLRYHPFFVALWAIGGVSGFPILAPRAARAIAISAAVLLLVAGIFHPLWFGAQMDSSAGETIQLCAAAFYGCILFYLPPGLHCPARLVATANFSYSLYVLHWPLLMLALSLSQDWTGHSIARSVAAASLACFVVVAIVISSAVLLERPAQFRRVLQGLLPSGRKTANGYLIAAVCLMLLMAACRLLVHSLPKT